jgi:hypothetical protein
MLCILLVLLFSKAFSHDFNHALHFPQQVSLDNYVILQPDFQKAQDELSVCSWLKVTIDSGLPWFSYATKNDDNTILLKARTHNIMRTTSTRQEFRWDEVTLIKNEWYNLCFTWKSEDMDFYINGVKVRSENTGPAGRIILGGTLVLGQEQDSIGGSFHINDVFGGEMHNINVFKKKLSQEDVVGMFYGGRCKEVERSLSYHIILSWSDILRAERHGAVTEVEAGCDKWGIFIDNV